MSTFAKTNRLTLRPYDPSRGDDVNVVEAFYSFDNMLFGTRNIAPVKPRDRTGIVDSINSSLFFAVIDVRAVDSSHRDDFAGLVMLEQVGSPRNRKASLAISFLPAHWGKGYGTEVMQWLLEHAFNHLALHRMSLDVLATNERAIAMYKKVGFVEEGRQREVVWINGKWVDGITMGCLEQDWLALRAKQ